MSNEILNSLLREYSQKKITAEMDLERRKENLYKLIPRLAQIDSELQKSAILTTKSILNNSSSNSSIDELKEKIKKLKYEKEQILLKNNYSLDYLKPFYECKICNDTGFVLNSDYKTSMCNCLKQKLLDYSINKSNMYNLKNENFNKFDESIFTDDVDLAKYRFNISPRKNIMNIKNKCIDFVNNFDDISQKNLLFVGSTGLR